MGEILCSCLNQSIVIMFVKFFWGRELGWDGMQCSAIESFFLPE
jgi:hypothetical protein